MANPPKQKGTAAETELVRKLAAYGIEVSRMPASSTYDLHRHGSAIIEALATRPDRGQWLVTVDLPTFVSLVSGFDDSCAEQLGMEASELRIEVKRYARFALHAIWEKKFGGKE